MIGGEELMKDQLKALTNNACAIEQFDAVAMDWVDSSGEEL